MRSPRSAFDLRAALSQEVQSALDELAADRPKSVHRCRVHLKRARALARIGATTAPGLASVFNESARAVMRNLASARDLAALADAAQQLAGDAASGKTARALSTVAAQLTAMREAMPPPDIGAVRAGLRDLLALANVWPEASARQINKGAERIARRARIARKRGLASDCPARRHAWRKREKDRFYAALLLGDAWPSRRRRKTGQRLGDALGDERDALLLIDLLDKTPSIAGGPKAAGRALAALKARRQRVADRADALGAKLHAGGA